MASFAKAQLLKYGWTEGKGLGKNENGIVEPLKPKLKFDTKGFGHDAKEYKWWESVYDKAASNVDVRTTAKSISLGVKDRDAVEISTRKLDLGKLKKEQNMEYGSFLKTCTLDNGKIVNRAENLYESALDRVLGEKSSLELTDQQLFEACGGRTAHKGARHGLTLSGKLARIAAQEAQLLGLRKKSVSTSEEWTEVKKKKKLKRKRRRSTAEMDLEDENLEDSPPTDANANTLIKTDEIPMGETQQMRKKSKTARRKENRRFQDLVEKLNSVVIVDDCHESEKKITKKRKQAKKKGNDTNEDTSETKTEKRKKIKRKNREINEENNENKKCRLSSIELVVLPEDGSLINLEDKESTRISKKHKKDYTEADKMNNRIDKKKKKRQAKTEKRRVERLSECLMAVNLCEDSVDSGRGEDLIESCETSRKLKKWKKHKKEKKDKKIEEIIIPDP